MKTQENFAYSNTTHKVRRKARSRTNKMGQVKIVIEILEYTYGGKGNYHRKPVEVSTNIWVDKKHWSNKNQRLSTQEENWSYKVTQIDGLYGTIQSYISSKGEREFDQAYTKGIDTEQIQALFPSRKENRKTFNDYYVDYIGVRKADGDTAPNTIRVMVTVSNRLKNFDIYRKRKTYIEEGAIPICGTF